MADFKVRFAEDGTSFSAKFPGNEQRLFRAEMGETQVVRVGAAPYEGEYVVNPDFERQTLETANKILTDDITVNPIYVSRTTNKTGGKTIYIGGVENG